MTTILEVAKELLGWFNGLDDDTKKAAVSVALLVAAISPLAGIVSNVLQVLPAFVDLVDGLNVKTSLLVLAFLTLVGLAGAVIAAWDDMSNLERSCLY